MNNKIEKIVVVGGGTAGWMAAASLAKTYKNKGCKIVLVESADIGTIGVGEATIPPFMNFLKYLDVDEIEFIRATKATYKLAIQFDDWSQKGASFLHPFGTVGVKIDGEEFASFFQKAKRNGDTGPYTSYSPAAKMCEAGSFYWPWKAAPDSFLAGASYALHFDAALVAKFLRDYCEARGVERIEGTVTSVSQRDDGFISSLGVDSSVQIYGDFFIDCTGFKGLLIEKTLNAGYQDWSQFLPCNRAVAVQTASSQVPAPVTISTAKESGWMWTIPLQHRTGNGYVYCSDYCSDDQATGELLASVKGERLNEPRVIPFQTGHRKQIWVKNCLALGLASGFLEPLESTAIHLVTKGIRVFLDLLPGKDCHPSLINEYNRILLNEYETIRDFIVLHYCTSQRDDSPFWRDNRAMAIPETLAQKIALYKASGALYFDPTDLFKPPSWYALFDGMGVEPKCYNPIADMSDYAEVRRVFSQVEALMQKMAQSLPSHDQFIKQHGLLI